MQHKIKLFTLTLLLSCTPQHKASTPTALEELHSRAKSYCEMSEPYYDNLRGGCDGALFTSLHALLCNYAEPAQFEIDGRLCREQTCSCVARGSSRTEFSKDMAVGLQLYFATEPNPDLARRVVEYGNSRNWIVCDAERPEDLFGKCAMSPKIIARWNELTRMASLTDGEGDAWFINNEFPAHLDIVSIMTTAKIYGAITEAERWVLGEQAKRVPENLLFQAANARFNGGDVNQVARDLLAMFPDGRLPSTHDWCSDYLFQRDRVREGQINPDWLPCPDTYKDHYGTDFLFAAWVLQHNFGG